MRLQRNFLNPLLWLLVLVLVVLSPVAACDEEPLRIRGETMGTYYVVTIDSPGAADAKSLKHSIDAALAEFSRQFSTWDPNSEISRFNASRSTDWFAVSPAMILVMQESRRQYELSSGAFDPTVGPLIELWGFGREKRKTIPPEAELNAARGRIGMPLIELRAEPSSLKKTKADLHLNLSAIAPGYAIDLIAALLNARGHHAFLVDIGGEAQAGLPKATGSPWRVAVESPLGGNGGAGGLYKIVELKQNCIATSGDYRNYFVVDGQKFSHVIDPTTGRPVPDPPASVSVLHNSSMSADAWATTMLVLGVSEGMKLAEEHNLDVMFLEVDENHKLRETSRGVFTTLKPVSRAAQSK